MTAGLECFHSSPFNWQSSLRFTTGCVCIISKHIDTR